MDSSFKKKTVNKTQTKEPAPKPRTAVGGISRQSFRQIQQQFSKNRTNHQKVLESLERINAASTEKRKSVRVQTEDAGNSMISAIEYFSNTTSDIKDHSLEKSALTGPADILFHGHHHSQLAPDKGFKDRLNLTMQQSIELESLSEENASLKGRINQMQTQYKTKIYDHEVYIKQLMREVADLQDAWARSRQLLQQLRSEKQAVERQSTKDKEQYALLKEVLLKENQYYKSQIRILQRQSSQLRERLHKLAGLKSGEASFMEQISETQENEQQLLHKITQLQQTIKGYCSFIPKTSQYEAQISRLLNSITQKNQQLTNVSQQMQKLKKQLNEKNNQLNQKIQQIEKEKQKIEQINRQNQTIITQNVQSQFLLSSELSKRLMEVSALSSQIQDKDQKIAELETTLGQIAQQIILQRNKNAETQTSKKQLEHQLNKMKSKESDLVQRHVKELKIVRQLSNQQIQKIKSQTSLLKHKLTEKDGLLQSLQKNIQSLESIKPVEKRPSIETALQTNLLQIKDSGMSTQPQQPRITEIKHLIQHRDSEISCKPEIVDMQMNTQEQFADQLEKFKTQISDLLTQRNNYSEELEKCKQKLLQVQAQLENISKQAQTLEGKQKELLKSIEEENSLKDQREEKSKQQITQMLSKIEQMEDQQAKLEYENKSLQQKYTQITDQYEHFRNEYDSLTENHQILEQKVKQLENDIDQKDRHIEKLTEQYAQAQEKYEDLVDGSKKQCQECRKLQIELNRMTAQLRSTQYGYEDKLLKIEDENQNLKNTMTRIRALSKDTL